MTPPHKELVDHYADKIREQMHDNTDGMIDMGVYMKMLIEDIPPLKHLSESSIDPGSKAMLDKHIDTLESLRDALHHCMARLTAAVG